jgi:hypothetical protein
VDESGRLPAVIDRVDHLVYATPDVEATCAELEQRLGVRASIGGQHLGRGTRNALIGIGPGRYLEIIGPDAAQPAPPAPRWFGIDTVKAPRLVTWAAAASNLTRLVNVAEQRGVRLGAIRDGRRERPDGVVLAWQTTDPNVMLAEGLVPFFIDWGASPHPASSAVTGPRLIGLRGEHPDAGEARGILASLGIALHVDHAERAALIATFETANGSVELR